MNPLAKKYFELGLELSKSKLPSKEIFVEKWTEGNQEQANSRMNRLLSEGKTQQALEWARHYNVPIKIVTKNGTVELKSVTLTFHRPDWTGRSELTFDDVVNITINDGWIRLQCYGPVGDMYGESVLSFRVDGIVDCKVS